jgi:hypothetical protein
MSIAFSNILLVISLLLFVLLVVSIYFNIKHGLVILRMQDAIEECLDSIDQRYTSMSKVLEIPIFFDSVEVRQVIDDIGRTRDSLLAIANRLTDDSLEEYKESIEK